MLHIIEFRFLPDPMNATAGREVVVMNFDEEPHTVTSDDRTSFDLRDIAPGGEAHVFRAPTTPGRYPYFCIYHGSPGNGMIGTLVVQAAPPSPAATTPTPEKETPWGGVWAALGGLALAGLAWRRA